MVIKSFAKINLSLGVNKKLKNNLHNIQSFYCLVSLFDEIQVKKKHGFKDTIKFQGKFARDIKKPNNSIKKTLNILRKNNIISDFYSIKVKKKIPIFSGLGGGTSNSYYLTKFFTKGKMNRGLISKMEEKIGTDFKLFLKNQGFLKNLSKTIDFRNKIRLNLVLVYPNIRCSTRFVYSKVKRLSPRLNFDPKKIKSKKKFISLLLELNNNLQSIVEKKYPIIKKILLDIEQIKGCYFSRVTGSGSVCYGVFKSEKRAKVALRKIKLKYPKFWTVSAKTI